MLASMTPTREGIARRDIVIAVLLSALGVLLMYVNVADPPPRPADEQAAVHVGDLLPYAFALPLFLLVTVPVLWRRVAPMFAIVAASAGLLVNIALVGTEVIRCGVVLPTAFLLAFAAGSYLEGREAKIAGALTVGFMLVDGVVEFGADPFWLVFVAITVASWAIGRIARSRRQMAGELELRTSELREARDERARLEVAADRARLSGELDELLQRRLGDLARLAEGPPADDPAAATATLVDIERESRRTLEEMRELVGVLRHDETGVPTEPQPTLVHLEAMLVRAKGSDARLTVEGSPRVLPAGVELSAYRVVEHLLSALDDAPDVEVLVRFRDNALELEVSGPARRDAKAAIDRARERVRLQEGTLQARTRGRRAEALVTLPVLAAR